MPCGCAACDYEPRSLLFFVPSLRWEFVRVLATAMRKEPARRSTLRRVRVSSGLAIEFFRPGVLNYEGVAIWLEAHKQNFATGRPADDMTPLARFGELSLGFVFQALVPLVLILMAYAAFARERETGTLRLLLATGMAPGQLFVGKFLRLGASASNRIAGA